MISPLVSPNHKVAKRPSPCQKKFLTKNGLVWIQFRYNSPDPNHIPTFCHSQQQPNTLAIMMTNQYFLTKGN